MGPDGSFPFPPLFPPFPPPFPSLLRRSEGSFCEEKKEKSGAVKAETPLFPLSPSTSNELLGGGGGGGGGAFSLPPFLPEGRKVGEVGGLCFSLFPPPPSSLGCLFLSRREKRGGRRLYTSKFFFFFFPSPFLFPFHMNYPPS